MGGLTDQRQKEWEWRKRETTPWVKNRCGLQRAVESASLTRIFHPRSFNKSFLFQSKTGRFTSRLLSSPLETFIRREDLCLGLLYLTPCLTASTYYAQTKTHSRLIFFEKPVGHRIPVGFPWDRSQVHHLSLDRNKAGEEVKRSIIRCFIHPVNYGGWFDEANWLVFDVYSGLTTHGAHPWCERMVRASHQNNCGEHY